MTAFGALPDLDEPPSNTFMGRKVFIAIATNGEVTAHEGYLTEKEARAKVKAQAKAEAGSNDNDAHAPERGELTKVMQTYLGLHKHAAVRTELLGHPGLALRLAVAHMVCGSTLWRIEAEPQRADSRTVAESLAASKAQDVFNAEREEVRALLGFRDVGAETDATGEDSADDADTIGEDDDEAPFPGSVRSGSALIRGGRSFGRPDIRAVLGNLMDRDDETVLRILACLMAETLEAHTPLIETLGALIGTDIGKWWSPEPLFFDLLRDKATINAMLRDVAGTDGLCGRDRVALSVRHQPEDLLRDLEIFPQRALGFQNSQDRLEGIPMHPCHPADLTHTGLRMLVEARYCRQKIAPPSF